MNTPSASFARDRRFAERHNLKTALRVRVWKADVPEKRAESLNLSKRGIFFVTDSCLAKGEIVELLLKMPEEITGEPTTEWRCTGQVVRTEPMESPKGRLGVGVHFWCYDVARSKQPRLMKIIRAGSPAQPSSPLSQRQNEVLAGVAQCLRNKEIAAKLHISERTVKFHVSALLEKFDVRGRVELILEAAHILPYEAVHKRPHNLPRFIFPVAASTPLAGNGCPTSSAVLVKRAARSNF